MNPGSPSSSRPIESVLVLANAEKQVVRALISELAGS